MKTLYTIGHSNLSIEDFISHLKKFNIDFLVDVRTSPYSRHFPQYSQDQIKISLEKNGIRYLFLGRELGARTSDQSCYVNGKVNYDLLAKIDLFQQGLNRVKTGSLSYNLCLMCAEHDPLECHRMILVTRNLSSEIPSIAHILKNAILEKQEDSILRLREKFKLDQLEFIRTESELINQAFAIQADKIAYLDED